MFKPLLTTLILPPMGPLLLALLGLYLGSRRKRGGLALAFVALVLLWVMSCHASAVWLARSVLPQVAPLSIGQLKAGKVQAIVVLGGGVLPEAPEYGEAQPTAETAARLRYGLWLANQSGLPVAFSGGLGWTMNKRQTEPEADIARRVAQQDYGIMLRWLERESRDTAENARLLVPILERDGVTRVALVTHARHMPRSVAAFEAQGLAVTPAPMGFTLPQESDLMEWLPSAQGLAACRQVLREWLGITVVRLSAGF